MAKDLGISHSSPLSRGGSATSARFLLLFLSVCTAASLIGAQILAQVYDMPRPSLMPTFFVLSLAVIVFGAGAALVGYVAWIAIYERESQPIPRVLEVVKMYFSADVLARRVAPVLLTLLFVSVFNDYKVFIPHVVPFYLDGFLSDLDRFVFGTDPWRLTHTVIGPVGTRIIDFFYGLWFAAWIVALLHFSVFAKEELQRRFYISFVGIWILLGIVLAAVMSSAGPCFLDLIHHPDAERYASLFPLKNAPGAARAQDYLANAYLTGQIGLAEGISAMPSVHVAITALIVLAVRDYGRLVFAAALLLYVMIFVGSVHLGWHYVSDGLVGTAGAMLIWWLTGLKVRRAVSAPQSTAQFQSL